MSKRTLHFWCFPLETVTPNNGGFEKNLTALLGSFSVALWTFLLCAQPKAIHTFLDFSDSCSHLDFNSL